MDLLKTSAKVGGGATAAAAFAYLALPKSEQQRLLHTLSRSVFRFVQWYGMSQYSHLNLPPSLDVLTDYALMNKHLPFQAHIYNQKRWLKLGKPDIFVSWNPVKGLMYNLCAPELVEQVMTDKDTFNTRGRTGFTTEFPEGLLALETGPQWALHRRMISPLFSDKYLKSYGARIQKEATTMMDKWAARAAGGRDVNVHHDLTTCTLDIIGAVGFNKDFNAQEDDECPYVHMSETVLNEIMLRSVQPKLLWNYPAGRIQNYKAAMATARDLVEESIGSDRLAELTKVELARQKAAEADAEEAQAEAGKKKGRKKGKGKGRKARGKKVPASLDGSYNMLAALRAARDKATGAPLSEAEIFYETLTLMGAGHETTSNTLSWALYLLAKNPGVLQKLQEEVDAVIRGADEGGDGTATYDDCKRLPYTKMVLYETLRLYPTVPHFPRVASKATTLGGFDVPKGASVVVAQQSLNRRADLYEEPDAFIPERFDAGGVKKVKVQKVGEGSEVGAQGEGNEAFEMREVHVRGVRPVRPSQPVGIPGGAKYGFVPFGAGQRTCVGQRLAMLEGTQILATAAHRFDFAVDDAAQPQDHNGTLSAAQRGERGSSRRSSSGPYEHCDITLGPKHGLIMQLTPRVPVPRKQAEALALAQQQGQIPKPRL